VPFVSWYVPSVLEHVGDERVEFAAAADEAAVALAEEGVGF
jgi:hypothetical protein